MKKRLLSWLLVICLVLGMMPTVAFANEGETPAIVVGENITIDMKLNDWYALDLSQHFTAASALTYEVSDNGEQWTPIAGSAYNYYPATHGAQVCYFRATDAEGNVSKNLTLNANVEKPANKVTVTFSVSTGSDGFYACEGSGSVMVPQSLTVPYFDLALYGLEGYYYNPRCYAGHKEGDTEYENGQVAGTKEGAEGIVTVLHAFIYATEVYYLGYSTSAAGKGTSYTSGEFQEAISWSGGVGSSFMRLWDHSTNLNYYLDWGYPAGAPGWGSTADQIALYGGEDIAIHMIQSSSAYGSDYLFFTNNGTFDSAAQVDELTVYQGTDVELTAVKTIPDYLAFTTNYEAYADAPVWYVLSSNMTGKLDAETWVDTGLTTDENGKVTIKTDDMTPGTYYILAEGYDDTSVGTEAGAAIVKLTVKTKPQDVNITVTQNGEPVEVRDTGLLSGEQKVYFAELPAYGPFVFDDDLTEKLGSAKRYFRSANTLPYSVSIDNYQTKSDYNTVVRTYGDFEGLDSANTVLHVMEVSSVASNGWGRGARQYTLIVEIPVVRVSTVTLDQTSITTWGGNEVQLTATVTPDNATYPTVTWKSDNTSVAQVSSTGLVTCWMDGTADITATADGVSATCTVKVVDGVPAPTVLYSGDGWPIGGSRVAKVTAQKVQVTGTTVQGSKYFITLAENTPDDALMGLEIVSTMERYYSEGPWIKVGDKFLNPESNLPGTWVEDVQLVDGAAEVTINALPYWDDPNEYEHYWKDYGVIKTFYFSNTGCFPMAPMMTGGTSATGLFATGESYSIDLAPLFKNVSDGEMTYYVSINGAEKVACDANYTYTCDTPGTIKLVFASSNGYGESPAYTTTLTVIDKSLIHEVNYAVKGGNIAWFAFTDEQGNPLPEGTTYTWDEATTTWTILQPVDIVQNAKVKTYYKLVKDNPASTVPCLTGSKQSAGAGTHWNGAIRFTQTDTMAYGFKSAYVYLFDYSPYANSAPTATIYFNYERVLPDTAFEYSFTGATNLTVKGDNGGVVGHQWVGDYEAHVALTDATPADAAIYCVERAATTTLTDGAGVLNWTTGDSFWGTLKRWSVHYKIDQFPTLAEGAAKTIDVTVPCLDEYTVDLAPMFTDTDEEDTLTYEVRIDGGKWTKFEGTTYTYIPQTAQSYTLEFRCYDGFVYADDTVTINITATNSTQLYAVTANVDGDAKFFCFTKTAEDGTIVTGDAIACANNGDGSYKLGVPMNVRQVAIQIGNAWAVADVSPENTTVTLHKTTFSAKTFGGDVAEATYTVTAASGIQPIGEGNVFYLLPGTYTFAAAPAGTFTELWAGATLTEQVVETAAQVEFTLPVRSCKTITIDSDAEVTVFYQRGYYVLDDVTPAVVVENDNMTTTYYYSCPKTNAYSMGYMYFATKGDMIDKAGYMMQTNDYTVTWRGEERKGDYRGTYVPGQGQGSRGDDSVLVNVNAQNHLVLKEGETFRLRSSRIWEIINTDTENVMIEPTYTYTGYDQSIIKLTNANEVLTDRVCGTGGNNWMDITVVGKGVTFLEVGYEAISLVHGYKSGAWGGAGAASDNDFFNAIDPNRTALIVVQTDGMEARDVSFGIDCLSSNVEGNYYDANKAVAWDAEFDTLYFLGDSRELTLSPSVQSGSIKEVAVSSDKGQTWKVLTAEDGVYTAEIFAGNNIIRVTKDDNTTAYQLVRGDKITMDMTLTTDLNGNGVADLGDTVRVQLYGLHNPVGKMSGIYNPGFSHGQRITWTLDGAEVQQQNYHQYDFVSNAYITVTIPTDAAAEHVMTNGYINFNVFGDGPGSHRNLTDSGRGVNMSAGSSNFTRALLPDIVIYACGHNTLEKGKTVEPTCEQGGYTEYTCGICGATVQKDQTPALGHQYEAVVTQPTCTESGYTTYTCEVCGHSYVSDMTKALGHDYKQVVTKPTCTEVGYTTYTCNNCSHSYTGDVKNALGHRYVAGVCTACGQAQPGYVTPTVDVYFSMSHDADYLVGETTGQVMALKPITVPYFDLALYGLEQFYFVSETYGDDGDGQPGSNLEPGTPEYADGKITMLHLFIYATEVYYCGVAEENAGKGYLYNEGLLGTETLNIGGSQGSTFLNYIWGQDMNLNYYLNYEYPLASSGWGATSDQILLREGDVVSLGHFTGWSFYSDPNSIFNFITNGEDKVTTTVQKGEEVTLTVYRAGADWSGNYTTAHTVLTHGPAVYYTSIEDLQSGNVAQWNLLGNADENGQIVLNTADLPEGEYIISVAGQYGEYYPDEICSAPGGIRVNVVPCAHTEFDAVTVEPTCTEDGYTEHTCVSCGWSYRDSYTKALGHSYTAVVTAPTCTEGGYTTYTCATCNHSYVSDMTKALGHTWGEWTVTTQPDCDNAGQKERACSACGEKQTDVVLPTGHTYESQVVAPTCTKDGYTKYTCTCCNNSYIADMVPATGHTFGDWTVTKAATCMENGEETRICACGEMETHQTDKADHAYIAMVTEPTCTVGGYTTYTCEVCQHSYVSDMTYANGHAYGDWSILRAPTCTEKGQETRTCATCGFTDTRVVEALGHQYTAAVVAPTCTEDGYTRHTCVCGDFYDTDTVPATGHSWKGLNCVNCDAVRGNPFTDVARDAYYLDAVMWAADQGITNGTSATTFSPNAALTRAQAVTMLWRAAGSPEPETAENPFEDVHEDAYYYKAVLWAVENGITTGISEAHFSPDSATTRAQVVTFLWRYAGTPEAQIENPFGDVAGDEWYTNAVLWAVESGITDGMGDASFGTALSCNRAHMVTFLYRFMV